MVFASELKLLIFKISAPSADGLKNVSFRKELKFTPRRTQRVMSICNTMISVRLGGKIEIQRLSVISIYVSLDPPRRIERHGTQS